MDLNIYINDVTLLSILTSISPQIGDNKLVSCKIIYNPPTIRSVIIRNWKLFNKNILMDKLAGQNFNLQIENEQQFWNQMENKLISVIDTIAPRTEFLNKSTRNTHPLYKIKNKN